MLLHPEWFYREEILNLISPPHQRLVFSSFNPGGLTYLFTLFKMQWRPASSSTSVGFLASFVKVVLVIVANELISNQAQVHFIRWHFLLSIVPIFFIVSLLASRVFS